MSFGKGSWHVPEGKTGKISFGKAGQSYDTWMGVGGPILTDEQKDTAIKALFSMQQGPSFAKAIGLDPSGPSLLQKVQKLIIAAKDAGLEPERVWVDADEYNLLRKSMHGPDWSAAKEPLTCWGIPIYIGPTPGVVDLSYIEKWYVEYGDGEGCPTCGQSHDLSHHGEYPCPTCGEPTLYDE